MSLKALKEEMVAFVMENPPADTSVRLKLCLKSFNQVCVFLLLLTIMMLLCRHACCFLS